MYGKLKAAGASFVLSLSFAPSVAAQDVPRVRLEE
jgi:hypothetical protein